MASAAWRRVRSLLKQILTVHPDAPGWVHDPVHGPVLVIPVHPDRARTPYRVESPGLGFVEIDHDARVVRTAVWSGHLDPGQEGRRGARRSADDVRVRYGNHEVHLDHTSGSKARLRLDGHPVARFERRGPERPRAAMFRTAYDVTWEQVVDPSVALLGHALASRYGVGADGALTRIADTF